jgi:Golgi apparatus protein 1
MVMALPAQAQVAGPCAETVTKYCGNVTPGEGRLLKCLNDHRADQSIACQDWLDAQQKSLQELNAACRDEIAGLCSFDLPDSIRIFRCLEENYVALRLDCRAKLREIKERAR